MTDVAATTVLVVDDNPATRYSTSRVLRGAGFHVLEAETGRQAISLASKKPDIVVLDINLPDITGYEVCRELRTFPETARIPVVHLSASFVTDMDKARGLEFGADGYLTHPVEPIVLIATVNAFLRARQAEAEMRQSEIKYRTIFDHVKNGICLFTQELMFSEANPAICQMLALTREEMVGRPMSLLVPETRRAELDQIVQQLKQYGMWQGTFPLLNSTGEAVEIDWHLTAHSAPGLWLGILTDARERIRIEAEREQLLASERVARSHAERANRLKDDFLATLSHELRTPLSAIVGWAQVLKVGKAIGEKDFKEGIGAIERNARMQAQLIEDLLDVSRITSGKLRLSIESVDLCAVANAALESLMPSIAAKEVEIVRNYDAKMITIDADAARLQQVIWNLVSNAVKFSPRKGQVVITIQQVDSLIEIAVRDSGQGVSPEFLPHIFDRFRQEDASPTRNYGGLGLGLAIVKHLVEMHGGTIQAFSNGIDQGAEFIIRLPLNHDHLTPHFTVDDVPEGSPYPSPNYHLAGEITGISVLIVDDDDDTRKFLDRLLCDCGALVTACASAAEALDAIKRIQPKVIVSDIGMPNQSGYDLIRQVRQLGGELESIPAIALTAFARTSDRDSAIAAGFQRFLQKPVDPSELIGAITKVMRNSDS